MGLVICRLPTGVADDGSGACGIVVNDSASLGVDEGRYGPGDFLAAGLLGKDGKEPEGPVVGWGDNWPEAPWPNPAGVQAFSALPPPQAPPLPPRVPAPPLEVQSAREPFGDERPCHETAPLSSSERGGRGPPRELRNIAMGFAARTLSTPARPSASASSNLATALAAAARGSSSASASGSASEGDGRPLLLRDGPSATSLTDSEGRPPDFVPKIIVAEGEWEVHIARTVEKRAPITPSTSSSTPEPGHLGMMARGLAPGMRLPSPGSLGRGGASGGSGRRGGRSGRDEGLGGGGGSQPSRIGPGRGPNGHSRPLLRHPLGLRRFAVDPDDDAEGGADDGDDGHGGGADDDGDCVNDEDNDEEGPGAGLRMGGLHRASAAAADPCSVPRAGGTLRQPITWKGSEQASSSPSRGGGGCGGIGRGPGGPSQPGPDGEDDLVSIPRCRTRPLPQELALWADGGRKDLLLSSSATHPSSGRSPLSLGWKPAVAGATQGPIDGRKQSSEGPKLSAKKLDSAIEVLLGASQATSDHGLHGPLLSRVAHPEAALSQRLLRAYEGLHVESAFRGDSGEPDLGLRSGGGPAVASRMFGATSARPQPETLGAAAALSGPPRLQLRRLEHPRGCITEEEISSDDGDDPASAPALLGSSARPGSACLAGGGGPRAPRG